MIRLHWLAAISILLLYAAEPGRAQESELLEGHSVSVSSLATTNDRQVLLSGDIDGRVIAWDWESRSTLARLQLSNEAVLGLAVSPNRRQFAASLRDGRVMLHDVPLRSALRQTAANAPGIPTSIALTGGGSFVVTGDQSNYVRMWNAVTGQHVRDFSGSAGGVSDVALLPGDVTLLAGGLDGAVRSWNLDSGQATDVIYTTPVRGIAVAETDEPQLIVYGEDGLLKLFDWPPEQPQTLQPHSSHVTAIVVSQDGEWILTGGLDQQVHLSRAEDGTYVRTFPTPPGQVSAVGISADSSLVAAAGPTGVVKFWSLDEGTDQGVLAGHVGAIHAVAFHAKDNRLATAGADGTIRVWSPPAKIDAWAGHNAAVLAVAVTSDGKRAASASSDKTVRIWNAETGETTRSLDGFEQQVSALAFSPDGKQLACGDAAGQLNLRSTKDGSDAGAVAACAGSIARIVWHREGESLAVCGPDGQVRLFKTPLTEQAEPTVTIEADAVRVYDLAISPDGAQLYTAGEDRLVKQWSLVGELQQQFSGYPAPIRHLDVSDDGQYLVAAGDPAVTQSHAHVWTVADGQLVSDIDATAAITAVDFAADSSLLLAGSDRLIRRFDLQQPQALETHAIPAAITSLAALPDSRNFLAGAADKQLYRSQWCLNELLTGHEGAVLALAFDSDELISGGQDGTVRRWDPAQSEPLQAYTAGTAAVNDVHVSEEWIAVAGADAVLRVYKRPATPEERTVAAVDPIAEFMHSAAVRSVSSAGPWIVTGCEDPSIHVWHPALGEVERLSGHTGQVISVVGTRDGRVISGGTDNTARRWNPSIRDVQRASPGPGVRLDANEDGRRLLVIGRDTDSETGSVTVWMVEEGRLVAVGAVDGPLPPVAAGAISHEGDRFVLGTAEGQLQLYESESLAQLAMAAAPAGVTSCVLTGDGERIVVGTADNALQFYAVESVDETIVLERRYDAVGHTAAVVDLVVAPDDALVLTAGGDQTVKFWQSASSKPHRVLQKHQGTAYRPAFSPDGTWLVTPGSDGLACLWHLPTGECIFEHHEESGGINQAAFHPLGRQFAIACDDGSVQLFDLSTQVEGETVVPSAETDPQDVQVALLRKLRPDLPAVILSVAFWADGNRIAAGASTGEVFVWLVSDEESPSQTLLAHNAPVYSIRFNAAGSRLTTLDVSGHLAFWNAGNYALMAHEQIDQPALFDVVYSADGASLAIAGREPQILLHPVPAAGR